MNTFYINPCLRKWHSFTLVSTLPRGNAYRAFYEVHISKLILQVIWIFYPSTLAAEIVLAIATIRMRSHAGAWERGVDRNTTQLLT